MGLHSDQVFWQNFGKNWTGYKLLGIWPSGEKTIKLLEKYKHTIFAKHPHGILKKDHLSEIKKINKICILKPGDCVIFHSSGAHMTISISSSKYLSISGYESFITLHPNHTQQFLYTGEISMHNNSFIIKKKGIYDIKDDILDQVKRIMEFRNTLNIKKSLITNIEYIFLQTIDILKINCNYFKIELAKIERNFVKKIKT